MPVNHPSLRLSHGSPGRPEVSAWTSLRSNFLKTRYGKRDWLSDWFAPPMDSILIGALSRELVIQSIADQDRGSAEAIAQFYERCLEFR